MGIDFTTVAGIIAFTLVVTQAVKPFLPAKLPTKAVAVAIGAGVTAFSYYVMHSIAGAPSTLVIEVILGVLGGPSIYEILRGK